MKRLGEIRGRAGEERGSTAVEFGLVALPLCVLLAGTLDLGYTSYVKAMVQGALQSAARDAAIGAKSTGQLDTDVKTKLSALVPAQYITTGSKSFYQFSSVNKEEPYVDANNNKKYDAGECFEDDNDNGSHDDAGAAGKTDNTGNADEVVAFTVTATFPRLLPMASLLGWSSMNTVTATTMLRNQPFAKDVTPKWLGTC